MWSGVLSLETWAASSIFRNVPARRAAYRFPWAVPVGCQVVRTGDMIAGVPYDVSWGGLGMADPDRVLGWATKWTCGCDWTTAHRWRCAASCVA